MSNKTNIEPGAIAYSLSVVVPVYNEEKNLPELVKKLNAVLVRGDYLCEYIFIDDGSRDDSAKVLEKLALEDPRIRIIKFTRNFGQTAAMAAGIAESRNDIIVTLDADLQNDPADIPEMLEKLKGGYDMVCGWRRDRQDLLVRRKIPSWIANSIIAHFAGVNIHDFGCTLRVTRAKYLKSIKLYGEMHRFIPALVKREGARVCEMPVRHHARVHGASSYGLERVYKVALDLMVLKFLSGYSSRPIHFFGKIGISAITLGLLPGLYAVLLRASGIPGWELTPLLILTMLLLISGLQIILFGLVSELSIRIYFESRNASPYVIDSIFQSE